VFHTNGRHALRTHPTPKKDGGEEDKSTDPHIKIVTMSYAYLCLQNKTNISEIEFYQILIGNKPTFSACVERFTHSL
jgi:hypothetical protein